MEVLVGEDNCLASRRQSVRSRKDIGGQADGPNGRTPPPRAADPVAVLGGLPDGNRPGMDSPDPHGHPRASTQRRVKTPADTTRATGLAALSSMAVRRKDESSGKISVKRRHEHAGWHAHAACPVLVKAAGRLRGNHRFERFAHMKVEVPMDGTSLNRLCHQNEAENDAPGTSRTRACSLCHTGEFCPRPSCESGIPGGVQGGGEGDRGHPNVIDASRRVMSRQVVEIESPSLLSS